MIVVCIILLVCPLINIWMDIQMHQTLTAVDLRLWVFFFASFCLCVCSTHQLGWCLLSCKEQKIVRIIFNSKRDCLPTRRLKWKRRRCGENMEPLGPPLRQKGLKWLQLLWKTGQAVLPKQNTLYPMAQVMAYTQFLSWGCTKRNECSCTYTKIHVQKHSWLPY